MIRNPFYQANFCAECGVEIERRRTRRLPRYFCDHCSARMRRKALFTPLAIALFLIGIVLSLIEVRRKAPEAVADNPAVSALNATPYRKLPEPEPTPERVFCSARTKKGTPCRRMVPPGRRCSQHQGKPPMTINNLPEK